MSSSSATHWQPLRFGKYLGKTLPQVLVKDPDYFFWAWEAGKLSGHPEAAELQRKATSILPRSQGRGGWKVEYSFLQVGCYGFELVEPGTPSHQGSSTAVRRDHIDLSMARRFKKYDKTGGRHLVDGLRHHLFDDQRLTKKLVEAFFADDSNFARVGGPSRARQR